MSTTCVALGERLTTLPNEFLEQYLGPGVEIAVLGFHLDDLKTMVRCGVDVKRWADKLNVLHKMWTHLNTTGENHIPAFKDVLLFLLDEVGVDPISAFHNVDYNKFINSWKYDCKKFVNILIKYGIDLRSLKHDQSVIIVGTYGGFPNPDRLAHRDLFETRSVLVHSRDALRNTYVDIDFVFNFKYDINTFNLKCVNLLTTGYEVSFSLYIKILIEKTWLRITSISGRAFNFDVEHSFAFDALIQA